MIDLSQFCIFSKAIATSNTTKMVVTVDGQEYKVAISEAHEDEASPSKIKVLVKERLEELQREKENHNAKLEELRRVAAELGYELKESGDQSAGLVIPTEIERPAPAPTPKRAPTPPSVMAQAPTVELNNAKFKLQKNTRSQGPSEDDGLDPEEAEAALEAAERKSAGQAGLKSPEARDAPRFSSHQLPDQLSTKQGKVVGRPQTITKRNQVVKGRLGIPTTIPRQVMAEDGETHIQVVDTGGDKILQDRMRLLNQIREEGNQSDYILSTCRACKGTGLRGKKSCVGCGGTGLHY